MSHTQIEENPNQNRWLDLGIETQKKIAITLIFFASIGFLVSLGALLTSLGVNLSGLNALSVFTPYGGGAGMIIFLAIFTGGIALLVKSYKAQSESIQDDVEEEPPTLENQLVSRNTQPIQPLERTVVPGVEGFTAFGAREWQHFYGDVGVQPDYPVYPVGIADILNAQCPFSQDENVKVKDTHMLVLIPATVGGRNLTLNSLGALVQHPRENSNGHASSYIYYQNNVGTAYGDIASGQSYWVLMTRDVIPNSRGIGYQRQQDLVRVHENQGYTLPKALEAAVCLLMEIVLTEEFISGNGLLEEAIGDHEQRTFTRCIETVEWQPTNIVGRLISVNPPRRTNNLPYVVIVGNFSSNGISIAEDSCYGTVDDYESSNFTYGVAALRRLTPN